MLSVHRGHSTRYLTDEVATAREGYYTGAVVAGEPPGLWWGAGAETLGLRGEVDADLMEAIYTRLLDPRDPAAHDRDDVGRGGDAVGRAPQVPHGRGDLRRTAATHTRTRARAERAAAARPGRALAPGRPWRSSTSRSPRPKSITVAGLAFERAADEARAGR